MLDKKVDNIYKEFIAKRTYARWLDEENRRESWNESVNRLTEYLCTKVSDDFKGNVVQSCMYIKDFAVMPSMRLLWSAGKACDENNLAAYNCLQGDTLVLTKEYGNIPIKFLVDKTVNVLTSNRIWEEAVFKSYGKQKLLQVNFRLNTNTNISIKATPNHRWILSDGREALTAQLKDGDKIQYTSIDKTHIDTSSIDYRLGIQHGIIYGDGTTTYKQERNNGYMIRICSDIEDTLKLFSEYPVTYPPSANGDPVVMMYGDFAKTHSLKSLPNINETDEYLLGFLRGWLAADGSVSCNSQVTLALGDDELLWLQTHGEKFGFNVQSYYSFPDNTNYGKRDKKLYKASLNRAALIDADLILPRKQNKFKTLTSFYTVKSVESTELYETVYCANVPTTHDFVLSNGILTGNCAYIAMNKQEKFGEMLYVLMHGTGVGYSVERQYIGDLPVVSEFVSDESFSHHIVDDSKLGWKLAYDYCIRMLYDGFTPKFDYSQVRPKGARLKTFGGRASGPDPLKQLIDYTIRVFKNAQGRKLNSLEVHDICCMVANCVVVGGVRRSACISFSNLSDQRMKHAKDGQFWVENPQRSMANNSIAYTEKPDCGMFMEEWLNLMRSGSGERGIINVSALMKKGKRYGRDNLEHLRVNPCAEAVLQDRGLCNLTEVVIRPKDTVEDIKAKIEAAVTIGCVQATLTNFPNVSNEWANNAVKERLLGVSLTGTCDSPLLRKVDDKTRRLLSDLREFAVSVSRSVATKLGISYPLQVTLTKPSGTVSQLVNSASGIHPRYADYFIRRVRVNSKDPIAKLLVHKGVPYNPEVGQSIEDNNTLVFDFPLKSPRGSINRHMWTAIEQLEYWKMFNECWSDGNPSVTIYVGDDEWVEVGSWVYSNWDSVCGLSFLPKDNGVYQLAPYEEIDANTYYDLLKPWKNIELDFDAELSLYELTDTTEGAKTFACTGGSCEI